MKYVNIIVFSGLMMFVAGCQKQQDSHSAQKSKPQTKQKIARTGATKLETKKSVEHKKASTQEKTAQKK
jgi:hypothetical protein